MSYPIRSDVFDLFRKDYRQVVEITFNGINEDLILTEKDIILGGLSVNRYCSSGNRIEIGSVVAAELSLELDNHDGRFNDVLFEGAELFVKVGIKKWDAMRWEKATVQYIPFGYFTIDEAPRKLEKISLSALDRMVMFDKVVNPTQFSFPETIDSLLRKICTICGVTLGTNSQNLTNASYTVDSLPDGDNLTYRQYLSWICEITGTCAFIDWNGHLILKWYEDTDIEITAKDRYTSDLQEKVIEITGVCVTDNDVKYLAGSDTYAFNLESNGLIQHSYQDIADTLYEKLGGFSYTPFSATIKPFPQIYPLDIITFVDINGVSHSTIITDYTFTLNANTSIAGKGETATNDGYASLNPLTKKESVIINSMNKKVDQGLDSAMRSLLSFNEMLTNSMGLYFTANKQTDGSYKYYMHDAPNLKDSLTIYTLTTNGFAFTKSGWNNGSPVWQYGVDSDGNAILNTLTVGTVLVDLISASNGTLNLTGNRVVIDSSNFQLNAEGSVTMQNAEVTGMVTSGTENGKSSISLFNGSLWIDRASDNTTLGFISPRANETGIEFTTFSGTHLVFRGIANSSELFLNYGANTYGEQFLTCVGNAMIQGTLLFAGTSSDGTKVQVSLRPVLLNGASGLQINGSTLVSGNAAITGNLTVNGDFGVSGTKNRIVNTETEGQRKMYAYETAAPYFGDIGSAIIGSDGTVNVPIDEIFAQTVDIDEIKIFCQAYNGSVSIEKNSHGFKLTGIPGTQIDWEMKAPQRGYTDVRLEQFVNEGVMKNAECY